MGKRDGGLMDKTMEEKIEKVLNEYRVRCVHGKKIGISQEEALTQLTEIIEQEKEQMRIGIDNTTLYEIILQTHHTKTCRQDIAHKIAHALAIRVEEWAKIVSGKIE